MDLDVPSEPAATALEAAVDGVRTALGHLIKVVDDSALTDLGAVGLVGFLAEGAGPQHLAGGGWTCRLNDDGLPVWIPPQWIDRQRRPILNPRITVGNWKPQDPLDLD